MDFRIVDPLTDPPGIEEFHTERLLYMPRVQSCYRPFDDAIEPFPLSAISAGHITFGSFNDFTKISDTILDCWTNILLALPDARLRIMRVPGKERIERAVSRMVAAGISEHRLEWALDQAVPPPAQLRFAGIDIALDSYPFNGMTTTCECLWMGIPVVSLYGANGLSRAGLTVFNCLNLGELAVSSPGAYVKCAVTLATDLAKLSELRKQLRERMRHSPLCDGAGLTGELETLYREAWQQRSALR
jgi:predicted O-linked N-acetylglucosamine transferase (SPINDLY family)